MHSPTRPLLVPRRSFIATLPAVAAMPLIAHAGQDRAPLETASPPSSVPDAFPAQDPDVVREVVGASHGNLARVRELVEARPALAKATYDWGFGDWESALGAAAHTGRREIAELLIAHGARPDIFSAAMLGQLDVVKAFVVAYQGSQPVQRIPGPHGIPLLSHAQAGGESAQAVVEYLESLGDAGIEPTSEPLTEEQVQAYVGTYAWGDAPDERLEVIVMRGGAPGIRRAEGVTRGLTHLGNHTFHPVGAAAVRIIFTMDGGQAATVTVHDPHPIVTARRLP